MKQKYNVLVIVLVIVAIIIASYIIMRQPPRALRTALGTPEITYSMPLSQFVMYRAQTVSYDNFRAAIFAQGQMGEASKLPSGSQIVLYIDANRINGAGGLQTGARCTATQSSAAYNHDTITMDKRFCPDFNDAILDSTIYSTVAPTEEVFLHKQNGERCFVENGSNAEYLVNPRNYYYRDYLARRISEKLDQFDIGYVFLDDLRPGWSGITAACGGSPQEYTLPIEYNAALTDLARFVYDNVAGKVYGNLSRAGVHWDEFNFLDGVMCESCFSNWGNYSTTSSMLSDIASLQKWVDTGKGLYISVLPPVTDKAANRFAFSAALLVSEQGTYFHFGDSSSFRSLADYTLPLGKPTGKYTCNGNICSRKFENGTVTVDFVVRTGSITVGTIPTITAVPTLNPTKTFTLVPTFTPTLTLTPICVLVYPDKVELCK